ncbi:unnamed protein product [Fusarium langsethiae]|nr:unnamed protein product [Fusarium langsethiae]
MDDHQIKSTVSDKHASQHDLGATTYGITDNARQEGSKSPRDLHGWKWALSYTAMLSTTFLFALDNTIVADIQPAIVRDLGQIHLLPRVGTGFALGTMVILPLSKAYGIFSIRNLYLANIVLFEIGGALCGAAPSMEAMVLGRVIAGVGGAGMYAGTLTYVAVCTSIKERATYMAGSTVVWGLGTVLGPVIGGAFAESSATWRWGFYINLVVGAIFCPAYLLLFPSIDPQPTMSLCGKLKTMDWPMTIAFLSGSTFLIIAISFGGTLYKWNSGAMIAFWTLSGSFLVFTVLLLRFHPDASRQNQLWPARFLKMPVAMNMQLQVFLSGGIILVQKPTPAGRRGKANVRQSITYYIPLYFQFIRGDGPLDAGSLVAAKEVANAIAVMTIAQNLGMVLFLSLGGCVFQNIAMKEIGKALPQLPTDQVSALIAGTSSDAFQSLSGPEESVVITSITSAIRCIWLLFTIAAAISFIFSLPLARVRLEKA